MNPKPAPRFTGVVTLEELNARWAEYMIWKMGGVTIPWTKLNGGK